MSVSREISSIKASSDLKRSAARVLSFVGAACSGAKPSTGNLEKRNRVISVIRSLMCPPKRGVVQRIYQSDFFTYTNGTCPKLAYRCSCMARETAGKQASPEPWVTLSNAMPIDTPFLQYNYGLLKKFLGFLVQRQLRQSPLIISNHFSSFYYRYF